MQNTKNRIINNSSISNKLSRDQLETQLAQVKDYQQAGIQAPLVISRQIEEIDILNYLSTAKKSPKVYWSNREGDFEIGGIGKSWEIKEDDYNRIPSTLSEISTLTKRISPNPFLKIIGGIAFDPKKHTDNRWRDFSNLWFILPEISIIREGNNYYQIAAAGVGWSECNKSPKLISFFSLQEICDIKCWIFASFNNSGLSVIIISLQSSCNCVLIPSTTNLCSNWSFLLLINSISSFSSSSSVTPLLIVPAIASVSRWFPFNLNNRSGVLPKKVTSLFG